MAQIKVHITVLMCSLSTLLLVQSNVSFTSLAFEVSTKFTSGLFSLVSDSKPAVTVDPRVPAQPTYIPPLPVVHTPTGQTLDPQAALLALLTQAAASTTLLSPPPP